VIRFELDVVVDRPVAEVFRYVTDVRNLPKWQASAEEAAWEGDGPVGQGSRLRERRTFMGRTLESTLEVIAFEPERRFDLEATGGPFPLRVRHEFEPENGSTHIHVVGEGEPSGLFRFAERMAAKQAERQLTRDFERLKSILESAT
jgi:uncharacterized protein YndB with AHSA1/START domain